MAEIWADYAGGDVVGGHLVGTRPGAGTSVVEQITEHAH